MQELSKQGTKPVKAGALRAGAELKGIEVTELTEAINAWIDCRVMGMNENKELLMFEVL